MRGHNCIWRSLCDVPCADDGQSWPLEFCDTCGLVRLARLPTPGEAYPATYYGTGRKKFLPGVEFLSHLSPALMNAAVSLAAAAASVPGVAPDGVTPGSAPAGNLSPREKAILRLSSGGAA